MNWFYPAQRDNYFLPGVSPGTKFVKLNVGTFNFICVYLRSSAVKKACYSSASIDVHLPALLNTCPMKCEADLAGAVNRSKITASLFISSGGRRKTGTHYSM